MGNEREEMLKYYESHLDIKRPDIHTSMSVVLSLKEEVNGAVLKSVVERLRVRFPYFYVKAALRDDDVVMQPNSLPISVINSWEPILLNSEDSNYHLAFWKYEGHRLAFEISHDLTDGTGIMP